MPVPIQMKAQVSCPRAAPRQRSPRIARLTSFSTITGASSALPRIVPIGTSDQPLRFGASAMTRPVSQSTAPGAPAPTASNLPGGTFDCRISACSCSAIFVENRFRPARPRRAHDLMRDHFPAQIGDREPRMRRPEIDAGDEPVARVELHEGRTASAAGGSGAEVGEHARLDQLGGEAADGGSGKAGGVADFRAREGVGPVDGDGKDAIEIQAPEVRGVADRITSVLLASVRGCAPLRRARARRHRG